MKKLFLCLVFVVVSTLASAQRIDVGAIGGTLTSSASTLNLSGSPVISTFINNNLTTGNLGLVSFHTPVLATGSLMNGGTFAAGGSISVEVPGSQTTYTGTFVAGATWQLLTLANGSHSYIFSGSLTGPTGTATFLLSTVIGPLWNGSTSVTSFNLSIP